MGSGTVLKLALALAFSLGLAGCQDQGSVRGTLTLVEVSTPLGELPPYNVTEGDLAAYPPLKAVWEKRLEEEAATGNQSVEFVIALWEKDWKSMEDFFHHVMAVIPSHQNAHAASVQIDGNYYMLYLSITLFD